MDVPIDQCHGTSQYQPHLCHACVSDVTSTGRAFLHGRLKKMKTGEREAIKSPVRVVSMDEVIGRGRTVSLWHLDVEGAEVTVLHSAKRLFAEGRIERIMLEFIPARWPSQNITRTDSLARLHKLFIGWKCHVVCPWGGPEHHEQPFNFTSRMVGTHIEMRGGRTTCSDVFCAAPGVD